MPKTYDIICIGSATRDAYIESNALKTIEDPSFVTGKGVCVPSGSKVAAENLHFTTGGSAVNVAVTFSAQQLKTGIVGKIGKDFNGEAVKHRMEELDVSTEYLRQSEKHPTAFSVVVHSPEGERSIFVYRGASRELSKEEFDFDLLKNTNWIYVAHLGGRAEEIFKPLIKKAGENNVGVALNPGSTQLKMGEDLIPLLKNVDILFLNQEEAAQLTGIDYKKEDEIFDKMDEWVSGIVAMTKGPKGVVVSDGNKRWESPALEEPNFIDRTGAGDAFGSGFTSAIINGGSVEDAIQLGSANATGVVTAWGANRGLLEKGEKPDKFGKLEINAR